MDRSSVRRIWLLLALLTAGRLALAPAFDLMPQEAYYVLYAEYPALSYFDHPPMIGWLLWLSLAAVGKSVLAVRLVPLVCTLLTQLAIWAFIRELLPTPRSSAGWLVFLTLPMTTGLSLMACPDVPLALFWSLSLLALYRAVTREQMGYWLAGGLFMGLALDSKYLAVFLPAGLLAFLVCSRSHRRLLRTSGPWLALLMALAAMLPVLVWNFEHDFASFRFQSTYRIEHGLRFEPASTLAVFAHQSALVGPLAFVAVLVATWVAGRRLAGRREELDGATLFLLCFTAPLLVTCVAASLGFWVKMNWLLPIYLAGVPLAAAAIGSRWIRWQLVWVALFHVALVIELLFYPWPVDSDDTVYGWSQLGRAVERLAVRHPDAFLFSLDSYKTAAELRFETGLQVWGLNVLGYQAYQLDYVGEDPAALAGRDGVLIESARRADSYRAELEEVCSALEELAPIDIVRRGEVVRRFRIHLCRGYRGPLEDPHGRFPRHPSAP